jgi:hypothetical protein
VERNQACGHADTIGNYTNLSDLVDTSAEFYRSHAERLAPETLETRQRLSDWVRKFHHESGTLTSQVEEALERLRTEKCLLLMTAHQPNLFAYSGVLRKATFNHVLAQRLSRSLRVPVVNFFGFADQDFTDDRWVRCALLPDMERREGTLELRAVLPEKVMLNKISRPPRAVLDKWGEDIHDWVHRRTKAVKGLARDLGVQLGPLPTSEYSENLKEFWGLVVDAHDRAGTYADFNAFVMSRVINDTWRYDTLFCRFSECQRIFEQEFSLLTRDFRKYSQALRDAIAISQSEEKGVLGDEYLTIPVWYHCDCGSKARLAATEIEDRIMGRGRCLRCAREYEIDFSENSEIWTDLERVSARALTMPLVFFDGLDVTCYVGGIGGRVYLDQAKLVAERMEMAFPPIAIWRPRDRYLGLGQLEALLTLRRILGTRDARQSDQVEIGLREKLTKIQGEIEGLESCKKKVADSELEQSQRVEKIKALSEQQNALRRSSNLALISRELRLIENAKRALDLYPCMVDYAINIGLRSVLEQWETFLNNVEDLSSDIKIETNLDRQFPTLIA